MDTDTARFATERAEYPAALPLSALNREHEGSAMDCSHEIQEWQETSFTAGSWNVRFVCRSCGIVRFGRLCEVMG